LLIDDNPQALVVNAEAFRRVAGSNGSPKNDDRSLSAKVYVESKLLQAIRANRH